MEHRQAPMVSIRRLEPHEVQLHRQVRLRALQEARRPFGQRLRRYRRRARRVLGRIDRFGHRRQSADPAHRRSGLGRGRLCLRTGRPGDARGRQGRRDVGCCRAASTRHRPRVADRRGDLGGWRRLSGAAALGSRRGRRGGGSAASRRPVSARPAGATACVRDRRARSSKCGWCCPLRDRRAARGGARPRGVVPTRSASGLVMTGMLGSQDAPILPLRPRTRVVSLRQAMRTPVTPCFARKATSALRPRRSAWSAPATSGPQCSTRSLGPLRTSWKSNRPASSSSTVVSASGSTSARCRPSRKASSLRPRRRSPAAASRMTGPGVHRDAVTEVVADQRLHVVREIRQQRGRRRFAVRHRAALRVHRFEDHPVAVQVEATERAFARRASGTRRRRSCSTTGQPNACTDVRRSAADRFSPPVQISRGPSASRPARALRPAAAPHSDRWRRWSARARRSCATSSAAGCRNDTPCRRAESSGLRRRTRSIDTVLAK